jgi:hypothetical protein
VNIGVIKIFFGRLLIILCAKTGKSFLVEIANIRVKTRDEHIKPEVELLFV